MGCSQPGGSQGELLLGVLDNHMFQVAYGLAYIFQGHLPGVHMALLSPRAIPVTLMGGYQYQASSVFCFLSGPVLLPREQD